MTGRNAEDRERDALAAGVRDLTAQVAAVEAVVAAALRQHSDDLTALEVRTALDTPEGER